MTRQPKIEFFQDKHGDWWWHVRAANGKVTGGSAEGYRRLADCERGAGITAQGILSRNLVPTSHSIN